MPHNKERKGAFGRKSTPTFTIALELRTSNHSRKVIDKNLNVGRQIYNACLGQLQKRLRRVQADKQYRFLLKQPKSKQRTNNLRQIEKSYAYTVNDIEKWVISVRKHFGKVIGSTLAQVLAERAWSTIEKLHYHQAKKIKFIPAWDTISIENKSNKTGLRHKNGFIIWNDLKLKFKQPRTTKRNHYIQDALKSEIKFVRIYVKTIRGKKRYFVQLIMLGYPPRKQRQISDDEQRVGLDIGVSTIAVVSKDSVKLHELAPNTEINQKEIRRLQRKMDRSRRHSNPNNYNSNGTIRKVHGKHLYWAKTFTYLKDKERLKDLYRKMSVKRKTEHEILANEIVSLGGNIKVETMNFKGLAKKSSKTTKRKYDGHYNHKKRYGKTISNRAPALLLQLIDERLSYVERQIYKLNTRKLKASQYNHLTNDYQKKTLNERWNVLNNQLVQRDLYSAFLLSNVTADNDQFDPQRCDLRYDNFLKLQNQETQCLKQLNNKTLAWYVKAPKFDPSNI